jgi:hypothetical protein
MERQARRRCALGEQKPVEEDSCVLTVFMLSAVVVHSMNKWNIIIMLPTTHVAVKCDEKIRRLVFLSR